MSFPSHLSRTLHRDGQAYPHVRAAEALGVSVNTLYSYRSNAPDAKPMRVEQLKTLIDDMWDAGAYETAADLLRYFAQPGMKITVDPEAAERVKAKRRLESVALAVSQSAGVVSGAVMDAVADGVVTDDEAAVALDAIKVSRARLDELEATLNGRNKGGK